MLRDTLRDTLREQLIAESEKQEAEQREALIAEILDLKARLSLEYPPHGLADRALLETVSLSGLRGILGLCLRDYYDENGNFQKAVRCYRVKNRKKKRRA